VPKPPSNPQQRPATHRLDVIIFCGKNFLVDFILGNERFLVNFERIKMPKRGVNWDFLKINCKN
jgi:hypothetical protein